MAKLTRKTLLQFGETVDDASEIGQFGSYASPVYTKDIDDLQAGTAWPRGWAAETIASNRPFLEDQNAIDYVFSYFLCYLLQMGIPEYDDGTTYYENSIVQDGGIIYVSLQDSNTNNTPASSPTYWQAGLPSAEQIGVVKAFAGSVAPSGYILCDGSAISRTTYAGLFSVIGTAYGTGDGSTTFNIPDLRQRIPVGFKSGDSDFGTLGQTGGEKTHTLSVSEMPAHSHDISCAQENLGGSSRVQSSPVGTSATLSTSSKGGGGAHNNIQPYQVLNYIIKY